MLLHDKAAQVAAGGDRKAHRSVRCLDLDHQRAEHVDAEALAALAVLGVFAHRRGDVIIAPVAAALLVVIGSPAADGESANVLDERHAHGEAPEDEGEEEGFAKRQSKGSVLHAEPGPQLEEDCVGMVCCGTSLRAASATARATASVLPPAGTGETVSMGRPAYSANPGAAAGQSAAGRAGMMDLRLP